ncbi:MAG TPA: DUF2752 domain-containing protein [Marmoricola sp.]|nr:DUF2752 domain-containing protein [Marmoricola sp.]
MTAPVVTINTKSRSERLRPLVVGAGLTAAATLALHFRDPHVSGSWGYCPWLLLTGTTCPGCGALRAVNDLTNFDLYSAASSNLLFVLAVPVIVGAWLVAVRRAWVGAAAQPASQSARWPYVIAAVFVVFWVLRNLPGMEWLQP